MYLSTINENISFMFIDCSLLFHSSSFIIIIANHSPIHHYYSLYICFIVIILDTTCTKQIPSQSLVAVCSSLAMNFTHKHLIHELLLLWHLWHLQLHLHASLFMMLIMLCLVIFLIRLIPWYKHNMIWLKVASVDFFWICWDEYIGTSHKSSNIRMIVIKSTTKTNLQHCLHSHLHQQ